jgi:hypothetical protein
VHINKREKKKETKSKPSKAHFEGQKDSSEPSPQSSTKLHKSAIFMHLVLAHLKLLAPHSGLGAGVVNM